MATIPSAFLLPKAISSCAKSNRFLRLLFRSTMGKCLSKKYHAKAEADASEAVDTKKKRSTPQLVNKVEHNNSFKEDKAEKKSKGDKEANGKAKNGKARKGSSSSSSSSSDDEKKGKKKNAGKNMEIQKCAC